MNVARNAFRLVGIALAIASLGPAAAEETKPNVVLILADNVG
jgi:hypothetical protein